MKKIIVLRRFIVIHRVLLLFLIIFSFHVLSRFYMMEFKNPFGWDQVDNAWTVKNILVNHEYPLVGMQAKLNSGIYIGPLYFYLITIVYYFTDLDPSASGIVAGITSIFSFVVLFYVTKKIFSDKLALLAVTIYTVSMYANLFDRIQWPVNFIMPVSLLVFFSLYKILLGNPKYFLLLGVATGFSFHVHFTSIFYPFIIFLAAPFIQRNKKMFWYGLVALGIVLLFLLPNMLHMARSGNSSSIFIYMKDNFIGFHPRHVMQLYGDAFIKFDSVLRFSQTYFLKFFIVPLFLITFFFEKPNKKRLLFSYLLFLWFFIPWIIFSLYAGEISDYYFSSTLPFVFIILSYFTLRLGELKKIWISAAVIVFWLYFAYNDMRGFFIHKDTQNLAVSRKAVDDQVKIAGFIPFSQHQPQPFLYYLYLRENKKDDVIYRYFK